MTRGGSRINAGRRSTWASGCTFQETKLVRVPKRLVSELLEFAHERDAMTTDKPKLSAYVPQPIKERVKQFAKEREMSESQAVAVILAEYFGIEQELSDRVSVGGVTLARMQEMEEKLKEIQDKLNVQVQPRKDPLNDIFERHYSNGNQKKTKSH